MNSFLNLIDERSNLSRLIKIHGSNFKKSKEKVKENSSYLKKLPSKIVLIMFLYLYIKKTN